MVALVPAGFALGVLELPSGSGAKARPTAMAEAEPRLDRLDPSDLRGGEKRPARGSGSQPTVVQVVPPGGSAEDTPPAGAQEKGDGGEDPPRRILEENARLRDEVDHLKALEAARKRVSRTLASAGAVYDGPLRLGRGGLAWPVNGPVVSPFGQRWGRLHAGIDIAAPAGTVIRAAQTGGVVISGPTGGYGNYVCVQHTRQLTSCYAHLSRFLTARGRVVRQGDPIGLVGCTGHCFGDHLHFETWVGGRPVDPMGYF